jgi:hypothetical protein
MPRFKVKCYKAAKWDGIKPHDIKAQDEQEAAVRVCGGPLIEEAGKPGQLRAQVWPVSDPSARKMFYIPHQPISN